MDFWFLFSIQYLNFVEIIVPAMSIVLDLPNSLEHQLREKARLQGLSLQHFIIQNLSDTTSEASASPMSESALLQKINEGLPEQDWVEYRRLSLLHKADLLTGAEQQHLESLLHKIENAHAQRMRWVLELSKLRQVPFLELLDQLGINYSIPEAMFGTSISSGTNPSS